MEQAIPLQDQVAVVTGASRGIGWAIARRLGRMGAHVCIAARSRKPLEEAAARLRQEGVEALVVAADVSQAEQVTELVRQASEALGEIDILVNNAGVGKFGPAHGLSEEDWDRTLDINLKSAFLCSRAVAAQMIRRRRGFIINIASLAGKNAFAGGAAYCASKWGLLGFTYCLAEDLRGYGIRVSAVCPGTVESEFSPHPGKDPQKMLQPDDVAHAVEMILLAAPQSFISEVVLRPTQKP
jgi:NAD(P)-dependent dehydrogenase (short-subunit alcohol dehydrogenase family)